MKITKDILKRIIKEEYDRMQTEAYIDPFEAGKSSRPEKINGKQFSPQDFQQLNAIKQKLADAGLLEKFLDKNKYDYSDLGYAMRYIINAGPDNKPFQTAKNLKKLAGSAVQQASQLLASK